MLAETAFPSHTASDGKRKCVPHCISNAAVCRDMGRNQNLPAVLRQSAGD